MNIRINTTLIDILLKKNDLFVDLTTTFINKISKNILHIFEKNNFMSILKEINRINQKGMQQATQTKCNQFIICPSWIFAEKKVFIWVVLNLLYSKTVENQNIYNNAYIEEEEFIVEVKQYFPAQPLDFIAYQLKEFQEKEVNRMWSIEQEQLLRIIVSQLYPQKIDVNWKTIAYSLFVKSQRRFYRTFHQIRQKWLNYYDPTIKKGKWTPQQDLQLLQSIQKWGKRWSKISREIGKSRTQHMVKNRFNSLLKKNREFIYSLSEQATLQFLLKKTKNELMGFLEVDNNSEYNIRTISNTKYTKSIMMLKSRKPRSKAKPSVINQSMLTDLQSKSSISGIKYENLMHQDQSRNEVNIDWSLEDNNLFFRTQLFPQSFDEVLNFEYTQFDGEVNEK